ncbi:E3 ubiquitin protein ligase DRIP2 [Vitis vinifera]|uniref:E3 ubiquitin protein ligase DRIP2 n=1 Tax=Vitis vinifera TaxID=29760 RepID=A0A438KGW3_VITVI|nr:E3 ubiquitin protein ligase DRIP2 [Vitis vinifera]RVX20444.1 E3 ubiquitin protein ligase DRIP2 [Vitis vinifera]
MGDNLLMFRENQDLEAHSLSRKEISQVIFVSFCNRDVNVPVSFIQKYLMRKLDLTSETEVEIKCMGQPVLPTLQLHNLVDLWLQTASTSQRVPASIGSSGKEFVMVLAYARRLLDP